MLQFTKSWFLQGDAWWAGDAGASRGLHYRRGAWSLRNSDLLYWVVSLLTLALEGGRRWRETLFLIHWAVSSPALCSKRATVSVFQGKSFRIHWILLGFKDKLD